MAGDQRELGAPYALQLPQAGAPGTWGADFCALWEFLDQQALGAPACLPRYTPGVCHSKRGEVGLSMLTAFRVSKTGNSRDHGSHISVYIVGERLIVVEMGMSCQERHHKDVYGNYELKPRDFCFEQSFMEGEWGRVMEYSGLLWNWS